MAGGRPGSTRSVMGGLFRLLRGVGRVSVLAAAGALAWLVHRHALWGPVAVALVLGGAIVLGMAALGAALRKAGERRRLGGVRLVELDRMAGPAFEDWVCRRLVRAGFACENLPRSRDYGIDVVAGRGPLRVGVQAKRYEGPVGNHAVQEAIAGAGHHGCQLAAVVTQSRFTAAAREQARTARLPVVLIERGQLADLPRLLTRSAKAARGSFSQGHRQPRG